MLFGMPSESRVPRRVTTQGLFSSGFPKLFLKGSFRHPGGFPGSTVNLGAGWQMLHSLSPLSLEQTTSEGDQQNGRFFSAGSCRSRPSHPDHWKVHGGVIFWTIFQRRFGSYEIEQLQSFQDTFFDTVAPVGFFNCTVFSRLSRWKQLYGAAYCVPWICRSINALKKIESILAGWYCSCRYFQTIT